MGADLWVSEQRVLAGPGEWELSFALVHGRQVKLMILATHSQELYKREQEQREDTTACTCGPRQA